MGADRIAIEVACAEPGRQTVLSIEVRGDCTVGEALAISGIFALHPGLDPAACGAGIYGREVPREQVLRAGDRIEVLRPLLDDPRERRRRLARQGATMATPSTRGG